MPLTKGRSRSAFESNVRELMHAYKAKGKIGTSRPRSKRKAVKQAVAIAYAERRRSR